MAITRTEKLQSASGIDRRVGMDIARLRTREEVAVTTATRLDREAMERWTAQLRGKAFLRQEARKHA